MEKVVSLLNLYHSIENSPRFEKEKIGEIKNMIRQEIEFIRRRLPRHDKANISVWLEDKELWLNR